MNNEENNQLKQGSVSIEVNQQRRVMFKFDNDEPKHLNSISVDGSFIIELKKGHIKFEKDGKVFCLYIE